MRTATRAKIMPATILSGKGIFRSARINSSHRSRPELGLIDHFEEFRRTQECISDLIQSRLPFLRLSSQYARPPPSGFTRAPRSRNVSEYGLIRSDVPW